MSLFLSKMNFSQSENVTFFKNSNVRRNIEEFYFRDQVQTLDCEKTKKRLENEAFSIGCRIFFSVKEQSSIKL